MHDQLRVFRASTRGLRGQGELDVFLNEFGRAILKLEMTPVGWAPLSLDAAIRSIDGLDLAVGTLSPMRNHHPSQLGDDGMVLTLMHEGSAQLEYGRQASDVRAGEAVLIDNGDNATFTGYTRTHVSNLKLQRDLLAHYLPNPTSAFGKPVPADHPGLRLLAHYSEVLTDDAVRLDANAARTLSDNIYQLAALALSGSADARPYLGGIRAARLQALRSDIQRGLGDPALSIGQVARRLGISASYARRLFAEDGTSFAHYVLEQRLTWAHRLLTDPRNGHRSISSIAYEVGFGDLSYFNRSFRQRYGARPSDVRA